MADLVELTAKLVNITSVSFEESDLVDWLEHELLALDHLEVTRVGDNLVARTDLGRSQRLLLVGHTDTVPANDNATARVEGDRLWGLGSCDMKGGLAVFLELARTITKPTVDLTYVFYAREEVAQEHNGLAELIDSNPELLHGHCAILGEPTSANIEAGCQGAMRIKVTMAGARAHTARPWMGRNAIHRLAGLLAALGRYESRMPIIDGCVFKESVQAVGVEGGVAGNVVPDTANVVIHHRFAPDRSTAEAEKFMRDLVAPFVEEGDSFEILDVSDACPPSLSHPLLRRLADPPGTEVRAKLGWTDVARFASLGIPATNFGPGDAAVAHTKEEFVDRAPLRRVHAALLGLIAEPQ